MDLFDQYQLTPIINAAGTMTALGASRVVPSAIAAGAAIQPYFVSIDQVQSRASTLITRLTGAEAGCITACSAAGMTLSVAACMSACDLARIEQLPNSSGMPNEVIISSGHSVNYGAPVEQAIRLAGAKVRSIGTAAHCESYHLSAALNDNTAAALYVVSHHTVQEGQLPLAEFIALCQQRNVPVIVDMASEYDLTGPISLGAALVIYSGHKFLGGPTSGIVAGSLDRVRAVYLQNRGIGRTMKIGKEGIIGAIAAMEAWLKRDHSAVAEAENKIIADWQQALTGLAGIQISLVPDWTGNPITRLRLEIDPGKAGLYAWELADRCTAGVPSVVLRDDLADQGELYLDPCNLDPDQAAIVAERIRSVCHDARSQQDGCRQSISQRRQQALQSALSWPSINKE